MVELAYPTAGLTHPETWGDKAWLYNLDNGMFGISPDTHSLWEKTAFKKTQIGMIHNAEGVVFDIPQEIALAYFFGKKLANVIAVVDNVDKMECLLVTTQ